MLGASGDMLLRPFFGGWSLMLEGEQIGIVMDTVYAKVRPADRATWRQSGSLPFSYEAKGRTVTVEAYWSLPADAFDNPELLRELLTESRLPATPCHVATTLSAECDR